jgi:hypothetical protein
MSRPGIALTITGDELIAFSKAIVNEALRAFMQISETKAKETWLTSAEASLMMSVSVSTLSRWARKGILHPRRLGANYRFLEAELRTILDQRKRGMQLT